MSNHRILGVALIAALALPAAAQAHVTLQPNTAPAGAYVVEDVRVPNETSDAVTTKVDVKLPPGFAAVSYAAAPGWTVKLTTAKLAKPIATDDGTLTEGVTRITWTADSKADGIAPGQFRDFPISLQVPGKAGDTLTFKALQTYSNGDVVRWIGEPSDDHPAPRVRVVAAADSGHATPAAATASSGGSKASKGLGIAALAVGVVAALLAVASLAGRRRG